MTQWPEFDWSDAHPELVGKTVARIQLDKDHGENHIRLTFTDGTVLQLDCWGDAVMDRTLNPT